MRSYQSSVHRHWHVLSYVSLISHLSLATAMFCPIFIYQSRINCNIIISHIPLLFHQLPFIAADMYYPIFILSVTFIATDMSYPMFLLLDTCMYLFPLMYLYLTFGHWLLIESRMAKHLGSRWWAEFGYLSVLERLNQANTKHIPTSVTNVTPNASHTRFIFSHTF